MTLRERADLLDKAGLATSEQIEAAKNPQGRSDGFMAAVMAEGRDDA